MNKTKIVFLIKSLETKEQKAYLKFFKKNHSSESLIKLYQHIVNETKEGKETNKLGKEYILNRVLKNKKISNKGLLNLGAELVKRIKFFLINQYILEDTFLRNYIMARIYEKRQTKASFDKQLIITEQAVSEEIKIKGSEIRHSHEAMLLAEMRYFNNQSTEIIHKNTSLKKALQHINDYSILRKMKYYCELINRKNVLEEKHLIHLNAELKFYKENQKNTTPLFDLYENTYRMLSTKEAPLFDKVKKNIFDKRSTISLDERSLILGYLINIAVYYNSSGKGNYLNCLFDIYKAGDEYKMLAIDKYISSIRFHNIINIASFLKQYKWLSTFIQEYQPHLPKATEEEIILLSKGRQSFDQQNYADVYKKLRDEIFSNIYFKIRAKSMVLRSYYELNYGLEEILPYCKNFVQVINRDKLLNRKTMEGYLGFISIVKKIASYQEKKLLREVPSESKETFLSLLEEGKNIQFRDWLRQKINQL